MSLTLGLWTPNIPGTDGTVVGEDGERRSDWYGVGRTVGNVTSSYRPVTGSQIGVR